MRYRYAKTNLGWTSHPVQFMNCWRTDIATALQQQMMMSQNSSLSMTTQQMATESIETPVSQISAEIIPIEIPIPEKSIAEQLADIKESAKWLEELWLTEPELQSEIDAKSWQEFMDAVYENVQELEALNSKTLTLSEELQ